jgi:putative ABC transport system permease protein
MLRNYIKIAWRNLKNNKLYSAINITGLALGVASVLLIFLYIQHELSFDEYHEKKDRIYRITSYSGFNEKSWRGSSPGDPVVEMRNNWSGVENAVRMISCGDDAITVGEKDYRNVDMYCTESNIFNIFSFPLVVGSKQGVLDAPFTAVISQSMADRVFGEKNPVGKSIKLNWGKGKQDFEVTGVMKDIPVNTHFRYDIFLSYESMKGTGRCLDCGGQTMYTLLQEKADTAAIADLVLDHVRNIDGKDYVEDIRLQPLEEIHFSSLYAQQKGDWQYVQILSLIALVILILGCGNYMNLATARYSKRSREVGIRKAVGAYRSQLVRQFLTETILITLLAIPLAMLLLEFSIPWFNLYAETQVSLSLTKNLGFYAALVAIVALTGILAGTYPALFVSGFNPREVLQGSQRVGFGSAFLRKGLVVFQFTASVVMIAVTILIMQQLNYVQQKNLGFDSDQLVSIRINDPVLREQVETIKQEFLRQSSIEAVTASSAPATGRFAGIRTTIKSDSIPGKKYTFINPRVDEDFISTMDISLIAGRNISSTPGDTTEDENQNLAQQALINQTGVKELGFNEPSQIINEVVGRYRIVGVVEDFHMENMKKEIDPAFLRLSQWPRTYWITVRLSGGSVSQGLDNLRTAWANLGASAPLDYSFVDDLIQQQYEQERRTAWVIGIFAFISIFIACLGLFGLAAFTARRRTKEIGIRKVMGATVTNVVALLSKDFLKLVALGFVVAVPIAWYAMDWWLQDFAYKIEIGVGVFAAAGGAALLIALATVSWQSVRAAVANPVDSLRSE